MIIIINYLQCNEIDKLIKSNTISKIKCFKLKCGKVIFHIEVGLFRFVVNICYIMPNFILEHGGGGGGGGTGERGLYNN